MSSPWLRAPSNTKNGNRPFPAINPHCSAPVSIFDLSSALNFCPTSAPLTRRVQFFTPRPRPQTRRVQPSDFWRVYLPWQVGLLTWNHQNADVEVLLRFSSETATPLLHHPAFRRPQKSH